MESSLAYFCQLEMPVKMHSTEKVVVVLFSEVGTFDF
jgi:hypothetical protein